MSWLAGITPDSHRSHALHGADRVYPLNNCYVDLLIELLQARGLEPCAMLGCMVRVDWEGDQFTYAKPLAADLESLYGLDVHETLLYRPLTDHIADQLERGRTLMFEADAYHLPDTVDSSYHTEHLKTTIAPAAIDPGRERLVYFHNAGVHELRGADYRGVFRLGDEAGEAVPEPFVELVRFDAGRPLAGRALRAEARRLLAHHVARRPERNPFVAWGESLPGDLSSLPPLAEEPSQGYTFVSARMAGSAFELLCDHVDWLLGPEGEPVLEHLRRIVDGCKRISFRLARRRPFDAGSAVEDIADAWQEATGRLAKLLSGELAPATR